MKEKFVPKYWSLNTAAISNTGSFWTDGSDLYSKDIKIGFTDLNNNKVLYNYTKYKNGIFISALTSRHVNLAKFYSNQFIIKKKEKNVKRPKSTGS